MATQDIRVTKKMGRPPGRTKPETATVRMQLETLALVDAWVAQQADPKPSRPEAIRLLLEMGLRQKFEPGGDTGTLSARAVLPRRKQP